jgi:hypothetical protein
VSPETYKRLLERLTTAAADYMAGARIIDVAASIYRDIGYSTPESCYQQLRHLFHSAGIPVRPRSWKHGRTSRENAREDRLAYYRENNRRAAERRQEQLTRCSAITRQ